ncbi:hypothetical protein COU36_02810 [Candidatus Micrarchaeota archaeon CG10_big_fil_rev_8_21_14_0_10_59_7]|nr:MAG: hypothetical protein COU36_02810 [Candidatus Micrarchaeota archaeon CG10_big_fil_rev_8_21_14_0_10_59_7]
MDALKALTVLSLFVFLAAFAASYYTFPEDGGQPFVPPYAYQPAEFWSIVNSFFFVLIGSALFFGFSAPLALGIEGWKYGSLFAAKAIPSFDLLFIVPQFVAAFAAILIGQGMIKDYEGSGVLYEHWRRGVKYLLAALFLFGLLLVVRRMF